MRSGAETEIKLTLIRHGAAKSNLERRYLGITDEALSDEGIQRLKRRKENGRYPVPEKVFSGPMLRCRQSAEILFPDLEVCVIPEWTEINFGSFEGKNYKELEKDADYQKWIDSGGKIPFPGGESRDELIERTMRGFEKALSEIRNDSSMMEIAALVHGGTIMALCSSLFGREYFDYQAGCGEGFVCYLRDTKRDVYGLGIEKI